MERPPLPENEPQRLQALHALQMLDTPAEERFDRLTRLLQCALDVPMATISLVDAERQWFKSRQGLTDSETHRDISFCGHGILDKEILEVPDALLDPRFCDNPLVTGPPHIRFYAGAPLSTPDGYRIGMLCAISDQPRQLTDRDRTVLRDLADCVEVELNAVEERRLNALLTDSQKRSGTILGAMPDIVFLVDQDGIYLEGNDHPDLPAPREEMQGRRMEDLLPPSVAPRWREALEKALSNNDVVDLEYELPSGNDTAVFEARIHRLGQSEALVVIRNISTESALQAEVKKLSRLASETTNGVIITDAEGRVDWINEGFSRIAGYTLDEMRGLKPGELLQGDESDPAIVEQMREAIARGEGFEVELLNYAKNGRPYWIHILCFPLHDADGVLEGFMAIESDVTAQKEAEKSLLQFKSTLDQTLDSVFMFDAESLQFTYVNAGALRQVGYSRHELLAMHPYDIKPKICEASFRERIAPLQSGEQDSLTFETIHRHKNGRELPVEVFLQHMTPRGERAHFVAIVRDITERKRADAKIHRLAYYDALTDLPNRLLLQDRLRHAMAVGRRSRSLGALVFLDIDDFKILNDTQGHDAGDRLLIEIADRIGAVARESDTIARLGGDEFVVMLENLSTDPEEAAVQVRQIGEKIRLELARPYAVNGGEYHCSASIGIALFNGHDESFDTLLKQAELAMYKAKEDDRNVLRFFDPAMQTTLDERIDLERDLRLALDLGQFAPFYQAQVDREGRVVGAEVLLRWQHPERGMVSPAEFIPLAEATGLIVPIGHWVLESACRQIAQWSERDGLQHVRLAVNVSAREFRQPDFVDQVKHVLSKTGADPARLRLELTESMVLEDVGGTFEKMEALKQLGIGFALDDFGTGHSSLAYLTRLPLDTLKIDSSFVFNLPDSHNDAVVAQTIISMARSLGLNVIAEGVETEA
ncbi:EAL domain-containing protein, partial [Wenzhouxiangella limi]